jgi:hypothetical protein
MTLLRASAMVLALVLLLPATTHAQAGGASGSQRPPVRASSTVEVIDSARGVDDIISRVRGQQRGPGAPSGTTSGAANAGTAHTEHASPEVRAERPQPTVVRTNRDQRQLHHRESGGPHRERPGERARAQRHP